MSQPVIAPQYWAHYKLAGQLAILLRLCFAGWIIPDHGWRMLFYVAIIPVVIAFLMHILVPEPEAWQKSRLQQPVVTQNAQKLRHLSLFSKINETVICLSYGL